jgi:hypothetical protein
MTKEELIKLLESLADSISECKNSVEGGDEFVEGWNCAISTAEETVQELIQEVRDEHLCL